MFDSRILCDGTNDSKAKSHLFRPGPQPENGIAPTADQQLQRVHQPRRQFASLANYHEDVLELISRLQRRVARLEAMR